MLRMPMLFVVGDVSVEEGLRLSYHQEVTFIVIEARFHYLLSMNLCEV